MVAAILDARVPLLNGIASALAIRAARPTVAVALMTTFGDHVPPIPGGNVALFQKPFDLVVFAGWLASLAVRIEPVLAGATRQPRVGIA